MKVTLIKYTDIDIKKYEKHLFYTFYIKGISRALLQELARHRLASLSVKSTRYTLKELKEIKNPLIKIVSKEEYNKADDCSIPTAYCSITDTNYIIDIKNLEKYLVLTTSPSVNIASAKALENLRIIIQNGISNDIAKYCLPESYKTELTWSVDLETLKNFLSLRLSKSALKEIQNLAKEIIKQLPKKHLHLIKECIEMNILNENIKELKRIIK